MKHGMEKRWKLSYFVVVEFVYSMTISMSVLIHLRKQLKPGTGEAMFIKPELEIDCRKDLCWNCRYKVCYETVFVCFLFNSAASFAAPLEKKHIGGIYEAKRCKECLKSEEQ
jgi:hypothetical protein